jgi:hypothetical protein
MEIGARRTSKRAWLRMRKGLSIPPQKAAYRPEAKPP